MALAAAKLEAYKRLQSELTLDESGAVDPESLEALFHDITPDKGRFDVRTLLKSAPRNSAGKIVLDDFLKWIFLPAEQPGHDTQSAAFTRLLTGLKCDDSGCVDPDTLARVLSKLPSEKPLDVKALLANAPRNEEGNIVLEHFLNWVLFGSDTEKVVDTEKAAAEPIAAESSTPKLEEGLKIGNWVVGRLQRDGPATYAYARIESLKPFRARGTDGSDISGDHFSWAASAKDDGWLEPFGDQWRQPGRTVFLRLLDGEEWVSAKVAEPVGDREKDPDSIYLPLQGVDRLPGVHVQRDVGMLFTPHEECQDEFTGVVPTRGGSLVSHLSRAFVSKESKYDARRRWVLKGRVEAQYPMRCVWVHPQVKEEALAEFVKRCQERCSEAEEPVPPEVVLVLGPPAAGKSSIQRLPANEVPEGLKRTVASLDCREEVNNDNLTDCMPGFPGEFQVALGINDMSSPPGKLRSTMLNIPSNGQCPETPMSALSALSMSLGRSPNGSRCGSIGGSFRSNVGLGSTLRNLSKITRRQQSQSGQVGWAMQWLVYAFFHHGPVRDSLAWDVIKVTVADAEELPVYYSSVMAGNAIPRTIHIVDLGRSPEYPVPHAPRRTVGFWPYTSQEARIQRARRRHNDEKRQKKLLGGNADSNLVNLHYHASQAEANIKKMLEQLHDQQDGIKHFLIIDNGGTIPRIIFDWAADEHVSDEYDAEMKDAARAMLKVINGVKSWNSLCNHVHRIAQFFLPEDDELLTIANEMATHGEKKAEAADLLPLLTAADEAVFASLNNEAPVLFSEQPKLSMEITRRGMAMLTHIPKEDVKVLKERLSELRKFCVVIAMEDIRNDSDESSESDSDESDFNDRIPVVGLDCIDEASELDTLFCGVGLELGRTLKFA